MEDDSVSLCMSPQGYHDADPAGDVLNLLITHLFDYVMPGLDAHGLMFVTGQSQ